MLSVCGGLVGILKTRPNIRGLDNDFSAVFSPEAGFLVAVLDIGTIFEVKFQLVRAQNKSFCPVESNF